MLDINDFSAKQIVVYEPVRGDKLSYKNDNLIIRDKDSKIKYQLSCYRLFAIIIIGDCTITTGLLRRSKRFGFSICFMTYSFRFYSVINNGLVGNNYLHKKQYEYNNTGIGQLLILNKIRNQKRTLERVRDRTEFFREGIELLDGYIKKLESQDKIERAVILGYEGNAAKVYFPRVFSNTAWKARKPRIKFDYINSLLDIGYTILFNFVEALLHVYDFDVYHGVFHTEFYMRKSLVCDLMEPFRPIIDYRIRKGINLGQFRKEDFVVINSQYQLEYKKSSIYASIFMEEVLKNKYQIFTYIRAYYRAFMKGADLSRFPEYDIRERFPRG